jgi:hypothetical protein
MGSRSRRRRPQGSLSGRLGLTILALLLGAGTGLVVAGVPDANSFDTVTPLISVPERRAATTSSSSTEPTSPTTPVTSTPVTLPPTTVPAIDVQDRSQLTVVVANGARVAGAASSVALVLERAGYGEVLAVDANRATATVLYVTPGLEAAAERLVADLGTLEVVAVRPSSERPPLVPPRDGDLVLVIGRP